MKKIYPIIQSVALLILAFAVLLCAIVYAVSQPKEYPLFLTKAEAAEYMGLSVSDFETLIDAEEAYLESGSGWKETLGLKTIEVEGTVYYERDSLAIFSEYKELTRISVQDGVITKS